MPSPADELALQPLVARVERGEPLSEADLDRLARAAAARPDALDWQLCLAHALLNSDRPEPALALLERAAGSARDEPLVRLARARALGALERHTEAASELQQILARQPRHADALRALALLRLRAGAPGDAARLARLVLETDPLDEWSGQILAEAEAAAAEEAKAAGPSREEFARDLQRSLAERGLRSRLDPDRACLLVELSPGRVGRLSLASLHEAARGDLRGAAGFAESLVGSLARLPAPEALPALEAVRERVFPALRPARFPERAGPVLSSPGPAGLLRVFALDHPGFVTFLPPEAAKRWGVTLEELTRLAFANLDRAPVPPTRFRAAGDGLVESSDGSWDVLAFDAGDGYDAARLGSAAHRALLAPLFPGPFAAALPSTGYALLARPEDERSVALLRAAARAEADRPDGLCPSLLRLGQELEAWPGEG